MAIVEYITDEQTLIILRERGDHTGPLLALTFLKSCHSQKTFLAPKLIIED